ncbi:MAG: hypothetical protein AAGC53_03065 [Actinomycetota bacterium]
MAVVALMSQRGSPGTTTSALALAATWPLAAGRRKVLIEADPAGGVLALRYGLPIEPGLLSLAVALRSRPNADTLHNHVQTLPGGLDVVVAPEDPTQVESVLGQAGSRLMDLLTGLADVDVIIDLGRAQSESVQPITNGAKALLMVARPEPEHLIPAAQRIPLIRRPDLAWLLVGDRPYSPDEVIEASGYRVAGVIADDARSAQAIRSGEGGDRINRGELMRSASRISSTLSNALVSPESLSRLKASRHFLRGGSK